MDKPTRILCLCPKCGNDKLEFGWMWTEESYAQKKVEKCFRCPKCKTNFKFKDVIFEYANMV